MLRKLGDPRWNAGDREKLKARVVQAIRQSGAKAIFGDEAQRLVDRNGEVVRDDVADFIKELHLATGCVFILVGLGRFERLVLKDWQIGRRWDAPIRLLPYTPYDYRTYARTADWEDYADWLVTLHGKLPIPLARALSVDSGDVQAAELALLRFLNASQGSPGNDKKLLKSCLRIPIEGRDGARDHHPGNTRRGFRPSFRRGKRTSQPVRSCLDGMAALWHAETAADVR